jgi:hypothetical protein
VSINDDSSHYVYILTRTISFERQPKVKMNIHNQCLDFKLINLTHCAPYMDEKPDVEVDAGSMTSTALESYYAVFGGGLTYQLQKNVSNLMINSSQHILYCSLLGNMKVMSFVHMYV